MAKLSRSPRSGNSTPLTPLIRLAPLLVLGSLLTWGMGSGCGMFTTPSPGEARQRAKESIGAAVQALQSGNQDLADLKAAEAVNQLGGSSDDVAWVARELTRSGRQHTALRLLKVATRTPAFNDDPNVYLRLALAQGQLGDQNGAKLSLEEAVRRAESLRTGTAKSKEVRADELVRAGIFWADPENPRADTIKALDALRAAYELLPKAAFTQRSLGYALADRGTTPAQYKEALTLTTKAADQLPENGVVLNALGWALYKNKDLAGARRVLRKAADLEGDDPEVRCHLGIVFAAGKQHRDAAIELQRALQLWPRYEQAERALAALPASAVKLPTPTPTPTPLNAAVSAPPPSNAAPTAGNRATDTEP